MNLGYTLPNAEQFILAGTKIHTMRDDPKGRWKAGMLIHHATGVRTKHYRCFHKNQCESTQTVLLVYAKIPDTHNWELHATIDRRRLTPEQLHALWLNDGFENYTAFREWFFPQTHKGIFKKTMRRVKLIHWTKFKY